MRPTITILYRVDFIINAVVLAVAKLFKIFYYDLSVAFETSKSNLFARNVTLARYCVYLTKLDHNRQSPETKQEKTHISCGFQTPAS